MVSQKLRVLVAAEYPAVRQSLSDMVREEPGVIVVGQAENSSRAIALARTLRPDVALVDCHLPQAQGSDFNRLSRIAGLDTAWIISEEVRNTQAIVLVNLNEAIFQEDALILTRKVSFYKEEGTSSVAFTLRQLCQEDLLPANPVFANLQVEERAPARPKVVAVAEGVFFVSSLALIGGLLLTGTFILTPVGAAVALVGLGGLFLGLVMRVLASVWPKQYSQLKVPPASRNDPHDLSQEDMPVQGTRNGMKSV